MNGPDPVSTWFKSYHRFKLQEFSRLAQNGTGIASGFHMCFQEDNEQ